MKVEKSHKFEVSSFVKAYREGEYPLSTFYDYPLSDQSFNERISALNESSFERGKLKDVLINFNEKYGASSETFEQIEKFNDPRAVAVVGGQQAGLLTGPLYTLHKMISVVIFAKEQEEKLQVPIVPIFWIAGEDHDIDEINHFYVPTNTGARKHTLPERNDLRYSASARPLDRDKVEKVLLEAFQQVRETAYTKELWKNIHEALDNSETYVDFFAFLSHQWLAGSGLVLIDADDRSFRFLQRDVFRSLIKHNQSLRKAFLNQAEKFASAEYGEPIAQKKENAHLFICIEGERFLLSQNEDGLFYNEMLAKTWTEEELLHIAANEPYRLSTNVVTRPLAQEFALPVLAFVAGPGELRYWGTLGQCFHLNKRTMPPLIPRLNMTLVNRRVEKDLLKTSLSVESVLEGEAEKEKQNWYEKHRSKDVSDPFKQVEQSWSEAYAVIEKLVSDIEETSVDEAKRYRDRALRELKAYQQTIETRMNRAMAADLDRFDEMNTWLFPNGSLQERVINPLPFLNEYGPDLFLRLIHSSKWTFDGTHDLVFL
ncbi:bacillithiol biosynthesis cysteine-adding enzyme BshC [Texcoconibacillus texcoconensis]|uniref:Putative cysteine ligase BshC n=1 Tax=Texcoconibacillus texcoconensis TaxID=1095777 RepID=A0A840QLE5_9BACI|nr:bacillithiol biosynthesis cysteine-adding enzyme BshC [Texcoconibacillus texcoconensis]MBB5172183.1 bacillithiol biosynthesis cysteine-adding enzyme BshC [Texcoconibacillus texcoconensis]